MKKFLFVAVLGALVACGETKTETPAGDTTKKDSVTATPAPAAADTTKKDSTAPAAADTSKKASETKM